MDRQIEEELNKIKTAIGIGESTDKFFTYPAVGGTVSLPTGTNTIDFFEGRAIHADDPSKFYTLSETLDSGEFIRSYGIEPNRDIIVYTDQNRGSMHTVKAGQYFSLPYQKFKRLYIVCTEATSLYVLGNTNPEGVPTKFSVVAASPGSVGSGRTSVTAAGTAQQLTTTSTPILSVTIKALLGNVGDVYVGGSAVSSSVGFILSQGDGVSLEVDNLTDVYIDAANTGDTVCYIYVKT